MPDSCVPLLPLLRAGHPVFRGQHEHIREPEAFALSPVDDVDVGAVHPVIVDDILTLEDHLAARFQHAVGFAYCAPVVFFEFVVSVVAPEARGHRHLAVVFAPAAHVGQERRVEDAVVQRRGRQWQHLRVSVHHTFMQRRDVVAQSRARDAFPEATVPECHVALESIRAVQVHDGVQDFVVGVIHASPRRAS